MDIVIILSLLIFLYWEYKFSRYAKFIKKLQLNEPEIYKKYCKGLFDSPSAIITEIINDGAYLKLKTPELKKQIFKWSEKQGQLAMVRFLFLPLWLCISLLINYFLS